MACFSGFLAGREAAKVMTPRGRGTIIFTGATASLRGGEGFAAFASAKHGLRARRPEHGPRTGPQGRPRGPHHHRRGHRHRLDRRELPRPLRAERARTASSIPNISPTPIGRCTSSRATPGPTNWTCGPRWRPGDGQDGGVPVRFRQSGQLPGLQAAAGPGRPDRRADRLCPDAAGRGLQGHRQRLARDDPGQGTLDERRLPPLGRRATARSSTSTRTSRSTPCT